MNDCKECLKYRRELAHKRKFIDELTEEIEQLVYEKAFLCDKLLEIKAEARKANTLILKLKKGEPK